MLAELNGRRVFLTGGTGFFGKSILDMVKKGALPAMELLVLSRDPEKFLKENEEFSGLPGVRFVKGDVRDFSFPAGHFDCILHAAAPALTGLPPGVSRSIILEGTARVLDFARICGAEKLLFVSSGAVYGRFPSGCLRIPETAPCAPVTEYGIAKLEAEKMCLDSPLSTVIARCFAFAGPRLNLDIHFAFGNFLRDALAGREIEIRGDGTPYRSYLYADDLVEWLFTLLVRGTPGMICNVGSPEEIRISELARRIAGAFTPAPEVRILGRPLPGAPPERYVPDVTLAERKLGLKPRIGLAEAIELCRDFHRSRNGGTGDFSARQVTGR